jgi:hypothetical protein
MNMRAAPPFRRTFNNTPTVARAGRGVVESAGGSI